MKMIRKLAIGLALVLFCASMVSAQDLAKYRNFSLGMRLADLAKQANATRDEVVLIHQSPAVIQELTWWPPEPYQSAASAEPAQEIVFSFYNGRLYKIAVTYSDSATQGLTTDDMVRAISEKYGVATLPRAVAGAAPEAISYGSPAESVAFWQDSQYLLTLSVSRLSNGFQLVMLSKETNSQAEAATTKAVTEEREDAPQREAARLKKEADDLETQRQKNLKTFRP